jgi:catechol 2,3-dioxygenase-like lactoylglutathione lyase family enzyme
MNVRKVSPILYVEDIEPSLPFWVDRLGFNRTAEVPHGDRLGFVILEKNGLEIMYQTRDSVATDVPPMASTPMRGSLLFIEVDDIDETQQALDGIDHVIPRRTTFYGATEIVVREPAGNTIVFAQFEKHD